MKDDDTRPTALGTLLIQTLLFCLGLGVAFDPTRAVAQALPASGKVDTVTPLVDHHTHLWSYEASSFITLQPAVELPRDLAVLLRDRDAAFKLKDPATMSGLYAADALFLTPSSPRWLRGRHAIEFVAKNINPGFRAVPISFSVGGSAGHIAGYWTHGEGKNVQYVIAFMLSIEKDKNGKWRIAAESIVPRPAVPDEATAERVIKHLDAEGVKRAVVLSSAYWYGAIGTKTEDGEYAKVRAENDWVAAQVAAFPARLIAFCGFSVLKDYAIEDQKYRIVPKTKAEKWWLEEESKIPPFEDKTVHLLSGALLPIWKYLKTLSHDALNIVRTTTDDGTRLVGVKISEEWLRDLFRHFGLRSDIPTTASDVLRRVDFEKNTVSLVGNLTIRRTRFQGTLLTEVCPSTFEQIRELRGMGLINIVQYGKPRFFLPQESPLPCLERILAVYPPESTDISFLPEMQQSVVILERDEPVKLPEWLIEPIPDSVSSLAVATSPLLCQDGVPIVTNC